MGECLLCGGGIGVKLSLRFIFSFQAIKSDVVCSACFEQFDPIDESASCVGCSGVLKNGSGEYCEDCLWWLKWDDCLSLNHVALFKYCEEAQEYMKQFKYQGDVVLAKVFAEKLAEQLKKYEKTHVIVPIPSSLKSKKERGFNQVEVLLEEAGVDYECLLAHVGQDKKQVQKNKEERIKTEQPFRLREGAVIVDRQIILVDDVYTTGRTMLHAQRLLKEEIISRQNKETEIEVLSCSLFR